MMEILEMVLWIIAMPMLLFVGLSVLGAILGLLSDPYYGIRDMKDVQLESRVKQITNWIRNKFNRGQ